MMRILRTRAIDFSTKTTCFLPFFAIRKNENRENGKNAAKHYIVYKIRFNTHIFWIKNMRTAALRSINYVFRLSTNPKSWKIKTTSSVSARVNKFRITFFLFLFGWHWSLCVCLYVLWAIRMNRECCNGYNKFFMCWLKTKWKQKRKMRFE